MIQRNGIWIPEAPNLIINRAIEGELPEQKMLFEGWFDVKLIDAKTGFVKRHLHFKNLITNAGLDYLGTNTTGSVKSWAGMGTGGTAPTNGDTVLQTPIGTRVGTGGATVASGGSFLYWSSVHTFTFLEPNANGNLTEIGLFSANAGGTMWTRQLLKDGTGTPTVITKTAAEQLQVTYEVRLYSPTVDVTGTIVISTVSYNYVIRASDITNTGAWGNAPMTSFNVGSAAAAIAYETDVLGSTSGIPAGSPSLSNDSTVAAYGAGNFYRDHTYVWDPGQGNFTTGIGSMRYGTPGSACAAPFQINWAPKFAKTAVKRLTLTARLAWGRYP